MEKDAEGEESDTVRTKMVRRDTMSLQPFAAGNPAAALMARKKAAASRQMKVGLGATESGAVEVETSFQFCPETNF